MTPEEIARLTVLEVLTTQLMTLMLLRIHPDDRELWVGALAEAVEVRLDRIPIEARPIAVAIAQNLASAALATVERQD